MAGYHVENFGCRASQADGEAIAAQLRCGGLQAAAGPESADVVVLNTCSVTAQADRTARAFLRRAHQQNPRARILVTGCYAQRAPAELAQLPGVSAVIGNSHKALVPQMAIAAAAAAPAPLTPASAWVPVSTLVDDSFAHSNLAVHQLGQGEHTRPSLKVQDGCGNRCSFCIIPTTRGDSRSVPLETCLRHVDAFVDGGGKELVFSGINLGRWGRDLRPARRFEELVHAVLAQTPLRRLRLSSIEPMDWTPELIALLAEYGSPDSPGGPRLARHAHLPLQSGSDAVLRAMHRRYRPWHYAEKLAAIHNAVPDAAIGADVMVGFPSETEARFEESYRFIEQQPLTYLHLFPFSARPGTPAWALHASEPVPGQAVKERMARLRALIAARNVAFRQGFIGRELSCVTLRTPQSQTAIGGTLALTDNFIEVRIAADLPANRCVQILIKGVVNTRTSAHLA